MSIPKSSTPLSIVRGGTPAHYSPSERAMLGAIARRQSELIVDEYLQTIPRYPHSPEYRLGMIDGVCHQMDGSALPKRFKRGTAQDDAHWAGIEHGLGLLRLIDETEEILKRIPTRKGGL